MSDVKKITDHADRTTVLLPTAHARDNWQALSDGIIGRRGAWADDDDLYVIDAGSTKPTAPDASVIDYAFLVRDADLDTFFGAGVAGTVRALASQLVDEGSPASEGYSLWLYRGPALPRESGVTAQTLADMVDAGTALALPSHLNNAQYAAVVADELAGADWGVQELEGEFNKLLDLRTLALAFGEQLDGLGSLLGITRDGDDDETYRVALAWKAAVNASNGTVEDILRAAATIESVTQVQLLEFFPAHVNVYFHGEVISARLRQMLKQMPREGVGLTITSAESLRPLVFGPDGGWFRATSIYDTKVSLKDEPIDSYAVGDRVRFYDVIYDDASGERTVKAVDSVYDSVYDVTVDAALDVPIGITPPAVRLLTSKKGQNLVGDTLASVTWRANRRYAIFVTVGNASVAGLTVAVSGPTGTAWAQAAKVENSAGTHLMHVWNTPGVDITGSVALVFLVNGFPTVMDNYTAEVIEVDDQSGAFAPAHVVQGNVASASEITANMPVVGDRSAVIVVASKADASSPPAKEAGWSGLDTLTNVGQSGSYPIGTVAFCQVPVTDPSATATFGVTTSGLIVSLKYAGFFDLVNNYVLLENVTRGVQDPDGFGFEEGYDIYAAATGPKTLIVLGSALSEFIAGQVVRVVGSTGNDGVYTVNAVQSVLAGPTMQASTKLTLVEGLPSAVGDGVVEHASPEYAKARGVHNGTDSPHGEMADEWNSPA